MAAYFQLIDKTTGEPVVLQKLDLMMCEHFGVECDQTEYLWRWYDVIGFLVAMGNDLHGKQIEEKLDDWFEIRPDDTLETAEWAVDRKKKMTDVLAYLRERYTDNAWCGR